MGSMEAFLPLAGGEGVEEEDGGEQDGEELPGGHHGGKEEGAVASDGVRDEELPGGSGGREGHNVVEADGVPGDKAEGSAHLSRAHKAFAKQHQQQSQTAQSEKGASDSRDGGNVYGVEGEISPNIDKQEEHMVTYRIWL